MIAYWRYRRKFAVFIEISYALGAAPICCIQNVQNELIVEIPFCTVILTPSHRLRIEYRNTGQETKPHEKRNRRLFTTLKGTSENRS